MFCLFQSIIWVTENGPLMANVTLKGVLHISIQGSYQHIGIYIYLFVDLFIYIFHFVVSGTNCGVFSFKQVIIEGIGIFSISLGKDFSCSGFLHASLYLLLENLICSSYQIRSASDAVLHVLAAACGHRTVSI